MAKVVTSEGLQDYISTGKPTETIANDATNKKLTLAKKLEAVDSPIEKPPDTKSEAKIQADEGQKQAVDTAVAKSEAKKADEDTGLEPEDHDLADRAKKRIGKKHYEMKKAQEEAAQAREQAEADGRLAESLFNERELWKRKAEELEKQVQQNKPKEPEKVLTEPDPQKYYDDKGQFKAFEYAKDLAEYSAKKAVEDDRKARQDEDKQRAQEAADRAVKARIEKATQKYNDWEKVVSTSDITLQNECLRFMAESEYGMDIAYHLAKHPKDAERIRSMSPYLAVAELGKLQTQFEKPADPPAQAASKTVEPAAPAARGAPAPITPISTSGTGTIQLDPAKMSFKELRAYERERARNKR
jgi:hypothetical protein